MEPQSSHILSEVETLCERVTIIRSGSVVESGTLAELRHLSRISISAELAERPDGLANLLADLRGVHDVHLDGAHLTCKVDRDALDGLLRELTRSGVRDLSSAPPTLQELFLRHYEVER